MQTFFLRLQAPLQSWGERARWDVRDRANEPTKSGVVGLLASALGWGRNRDDDIRRLSTSLRMGVRCDNPGKLVQDYHTVFDGVRSADGKIKKSPKTKKPETIVSHRTYLADASFLVALQAVDETGEALLRESALAIEKPVWPVYLGRKSCPPAVPLSAGTGDYPDLERALRKGPGASKLEGDVRFVLEVPSGKGNPRRDEIERLSVRTYGYRHVTETLVSFGGD